MTDFDFKARVTLRPAQEGGRAGATPSKQFRCPLDFGEAGMFDSRIFFESGEPMVPGESRIVPVKMLCWTEAQRVVVPGAKFNLWEGKNIGYGEVLELRIR